MGNRRPSSPRTPHQKLLLLILLYYRVLPRMQNFSHNFTEHRGQYRLRDKSTAHKQRSLIQTVSG